MASPKELVGFTQAGDPELLLRNLFTNYSPRMKKMGTMLLADKQCTM